MASPIPCAAPVTMAVFPSNLFMFVLLAVLVVNVLFVAGVEVRLALLAERAHAFFVIRALRDHAQGRGRQVRSGPQVQAPGLADQSRGQAYGAARAAGQRPGELHRFLS